MTRLYRIPSFLMPRQLIVAGVFIIALFVAAAASAVEDQTAIIAPSRIKAFQPGETLTYSISWSSLVTAGVVTAEVQGDRLPDGREGIVFAVTGRTKGALDALFPVYDTVRSLFDPQSMANLTYLLTESYGKKKRRREVIFDHANNTVLSRLNDDKPETLAVPENTLDGLSMLYVLRMREDFREGKVFTLPVHNSSKNWSVEIHTLGRERITTPAGEFSTIKIETHPTYRGVFMNKGVVFIWLTDDARKIPVLAKGSLKVGSFVFTLTSIKPQLSRNEAAP